jgi:hypothetical protein
LKSGEFSFPAIIFNPILITVLTNGNVCKSKLFSVLDAEFGLPPKSLESFGADSGCGVRDIGRVNKFYLLTPFGG